MNGNAFLVPGCAILVIMSAVLSWPGTAQSPNAGQKPAAVIPHGQDELPGPPLTPAEAIKKMKVPEGFTVELVAAEPDIVNPVAMTFDERGRIWITESLEYPRSSAGPGRDRIKVLESTRGDGRYDKISVFADGLNIPSGIAVGYGGVWVANAPDILFLQDTKGTGRADRRAVVVTGFGRSDTHELPNSLTWGPDGWLYGLNGVFNHSHVKQGGKDFQFTCAMFRIHPRTREFQLFAQGTSNPWGIAWDNEGSGFVSACVIDHLWHLTETGYYQRQGGPYPPHTWVLGSIVKHRHQKAAYCGLHFFDSDAYPPEYRERLYMGNIHGGCINVDVLQRDGSSYLASPAADFLTANDPWFMPVVQKTGPDGCLYILDWYDRYHCYQDARRDPAGIDRERGRLYRIRYKNTPSAGSFDLGRESDDELIARLYSPNVYFRDCTQRLLCERNQPATRTKLERLVLNQQAPRKARMHALWALVGTGSLNPTFHLQLLAHDDAGCRAWGVRAAGNFHAVDGAVRDKIKSLAHDPAGVVQLQVAIAARKVAGIDPMPLLLEVLATAGPDQVISAICWQNLNPLLENGSQQFLRLIEKIDLKRAPNVARFLPRVIERVLGGTSPDAAAAVALIRTVTSDTTVDRGIAGQCLDGMAKKIQSGEITGELLASLRAGLLAQVDPLLAGKPDTPFYLSAALLAASLKDRRAIAIVRNCLTSSQQPEQARLHALGALIAGADASLLTEVAAILRNTKANSARFRGQVLASLGRLDDPKVADMVLVSYAGLEPDLQPRAIELLTQRVTWSKQLLQAISRKEVPATSLNVNHVRNILAGKDAELIKQVKMLWGSVRQDRNPEREKVVNEMRSFLRQNRGDPVAGAQVFKNVCAQCHKIHGEGQDVGPDITVNGRSDFDQLLSNVFDPSLVIGAAYQAVTVATAKGQFITGLVVEDNPQRVVLKLQGGKLETIARADIDQITVSQVSLMPEGLEKQLKPKEIADLFAFLTLDKPPSDPTARRIPGAPK
jgi:putative heme-binding domain-containing protein